MQINLEADFKRLTTNLNRIQRTQIPFAISKTLNQIAYKVARETMPKKADETFAGGATPFTKRGFKYIKSSKNKLWADVFIDKAQAKYMKFQIAGGTRFPEKRAILVATKKSRLNKYGNIPRGTLQQMIDDRSKFFAGKPKGKPNAPEGIWERYGRGRGFPNGRRIRLVALYAGDAQYRPLFPFGTFTEGVVFARNDGFAVKFRKNLEDALRTMRQ
jgi:hypothetical protein